MVPTDDDAFLLVDGAGTRMITLNALGGLIWEHLERSHTVAEIVAICASRYPSVAHETLTADVTAFLDQVRELGLVSTDG